MQSNVPLIANPAECLPQALSANLQSIGGLLSLAGQPAFMQQPQAASLQLLSLLERHLSLLYDSQGFLKDPSASRIAESDAKTISGFVDRIHSLASDSNPSLSKHQSLWEDVQKYMPSLIQREQQSLIPCFVPVTASTTVLGGPLSQQEPVYLGRMSGCQFCTTSGPIAGEPGVSRAQAVPIIPTQQTGLPVQGVQQGACNQCGSTSAGQGGLYNQGGLGAGQGGLYGQGVGASQGGLSNQGGLGAGQGALYSPFGQGVRQGGLYNQGEGGIGQGGLYNQDVGETASRHPHRKHHHHHERMVQLVQSPPQMVVDETGQAAIVQPPPQAVINSHRKHHRHHEELMAAKASSVAPFFTARQFEKSGNQGLVAGGSQPVFGGPQVWKETVPSAAQIVYLPGAQPSAQSCAILPPGESRASVRYL